MFEMVKCLKCGMVDMQNIDGIHQKQIIEMWWSNMALCGRHVTMNVRHRG